ncbi:hypothetical protein [Paraburkholderia aspalathi]|uniref:hypothetical protein n=1 Tax=Paraburkholderia aspalathi TaxID=1324617 RepID=UPI00190A1C5A|nr:hypothetical protein [Paraburkholderia aspalathi]MBK3843668.1 hypothetical protein [Paraburkholderia aspalathi]
MLAYLITLKIKRPDLFEGLLGNSTTADKGCITWIMTFQVADPGPRTVENLGDSPNWPLQCLIELHSLRQNHASGSATTTMNLNIDPGLLIGEAENRARHLAIGMVLKQIDLSLEI